MENLAILSLAGLALFFIQAWVQVAHFHVLGSEKNDQKHDRFFSMKSLYLMFLVLFGNQLLFLGRAFLVETGRWEGLIAAYPLFKFFNFLALPLIFDVWLIGLGIFAAGIFLRLWSVRILGRFFTYEIGIRKKHQLITEGPYKVIRHPSYTGLILAYIGLSVCFGTLFLALGSVASFGYFLRLRIKNEEKMLVKFFGRKYQDYMLQTKKLIPFVY